MEITFNRKAVPFGERPPMNPSELRTGTPALTARGMVEEDRREIVRIIVVALGDFEAEWESVLERGRVLVERCPLYRSFPLPDATDRLLGCKTRNRRYLPMQEQKAERTEQQIAVREVTHMQASWTEGDRGAPGYFTVQLILDNGAEEYVLHPTVDDTEEIFRLRDRSGRVYFDLQRKVLMFGNLPVNAPDVLDSVFGLLRGC